MPEFHSEALSIITTDMAPGRGPDLHRHPYEEVFVILEGEATFTLGDEQRVAGPGDFVVAPPGVPHAFKNTGERSAALGQHPRQPGVRHRVALSAARPRSPADG